MFLCLNIKRINQVEYVKINICTRSENYSMNMIRGDLNDLRKETLVMVARAVT